MPVSARRGPMHPAIRSAPPSEEGTLSRQSSDVSFKLDASTSSIAIPRIVEPSQIASSELFEMMDNIVEAATDKEGSKKLQVLLDSVTDEAREAVFVNLKAAMPELMEHATGNYIVQRILHYGSPEQRAEVQSMVCERLVRLSKHTFGCRVVQKALEVTNGELMIPYFQTHVLDLSSDQHGNHVLQKLLESTPGLAEFVAKELRGNICTISCQKYGCRVVQRLVSVLVENTNETNVAVIKSLVDEVVSDLRNLTNDQFGNYVVQAVMKCKQDCGLKPVYLLRGSYGILCRHKHASNVVETAYSVAPHSLRNALLAELCPFIVQLAADQFGNFVVQRIYDLCDASQKTLIANSLNTGAAVLKNHIYGRSVMNMLNRQGQEPEAQAQPKPYHCPPLQPLQQPLPQSYYYGQPCASQGYPASPITPLTPATATTTTTTSGDWTHNPNYDLPDPSPTCYQQPAAPIDQSDSWAHTSYDSEYAY
eukprot:TRINITY_DN833_c2_g1_i2.p1 TRINITY_DN833_c2_g1~~TRINITY_DN833_c2_g1_i2.p1  ORF type:complete len:479 (+),score=136.07 TRINITY_DN833_c2_g1_i2:61-1497(+)